MYGAFQDMQGGLFGNDAASATNLSKALTGGYLTDVANYAGGQALQAQSLDRLLYDVIFNDSAFKFFRLLKSTPATAMVDEYTIRKEYGGSPYGGVAGEATNPPVNTADLARKVGYPKWYRTLRNVSHPMMLTGNIMSAEAEEDEAGVRFLSAAVERDCFFGNSAVIPESSDGLLAITRANGTSQNVVDMNGTALTDHRKVERMAEIVAGYGGTPTHFFMDTWTAGDVNNAMLAAQRFSAEAVRNESGLYTGTQFAGLNSSWGLVKFENSLFLKSDRGTWEMTTPMDKAPSTSRGGDTANPAPSAPTVVALTPAGSGAAPTNLPAGTYWYKVSAVNKNGESAALAAAAGVATMGAGNTHITVTITSVDSTITGFRIYRSAKNAASNADCRFLCEVAAGGTGTDTKSDDGTWVPGTCTAFMVDASPGRAAVDVRTLLPMAKIPYIPGPGAAKQWFIMQYWYLRVRAPKRNVAVINILPTTLNETWAPLG